MLITAGRLLQGPAGGTGSWAMACCQVVSRKVAGMGEGGANERWEVDGSRTRGARRDLWVLMLCTS